MGNRVVLGQQNDGTYGLRVSAPGVDAFVGTGQGGNFTFNSDWADITKIQQVGLATFPSATLTVSWPSLGYKPFIEVRKYLSNVVYDDYFNSTFKSGGYFQINSVNSFTSPNGTAGDTVLYIVYAIAVPSG